MYWSTLKKQERPTLNAIYSNIGGVRLKPKVSVIMPVYNAEKHLDNSIASVFNQNYSNIELIAVNDGSKDNSLEVLHEMAKDKPNFIVLDKPNGGPGDARNLGLKSATGEYIFFSDSDDTICKGAISHAVDSIADCDLLIGKFNMLMGDKVSERGLIDKEKTLGRDEFLARYVRYPGSFYYSALWNKLYKRDIIAKNNLSFNANIAWGEDFVFNVHYNYYVNNVKIVPFCMYNHIWNISGQTWTTLYRLPRNILTKKLMYKELKALYKYAGKYKEYWLYVTRYIFNVTLLD
jgi:glycosyltransferase involved in cell wall biosynthesis